MKSPLVCLHTLFRRPARRQRNDGHLFQQQEAKNFLLVPGHLTWRSGRLVCAFFDEARWNFLSGHGRRLPSRRLALSHQCFLEPLICVVSWIFFESAEAIRILGISGRAPSKFSRLLRRASKF